MSEGLPADATGKIKGERLHRGADGRLYTAHPDGGSVKGLPGGCGCRVGPAAEKRRGGLAFALLACTAIAILLRARAPSRAAGPLGARLLRASRKVHLWTGVGVGLFLLVEAVTGLVLMHEDDVPGLRASVPLAWLPAGYGAEEGPERMEAVALDPLRAGTLFVGTQQGLYRSGDGAHGFERASPGAALGHVKALVHDGARLFVAHRDGFAQCDADGEGCVDRTPDGLARREARAVLIDGARIVVAFHHEGLYAGEASGGALAPLRREDVACTHRVARGVSLGKLFADLHTGKLFGGWLTLLYDVTALSVIAFVATGMHLWLAPIWMRRRRAGTRA